MKDLTCFFSLLGRNVCSSGLLWPPSEFGLAGGSEGRKGERKGWVKVENEV